jgi:hypothetical protein
MCGVAACRSASPVRLRSAGGRSADATCLTGGNCAIFDKTYKKLGRLFRGHQQVVIAAVSTPPTLPRLAIRVYAYRRSTAYVSGACQTARRGRFSQELSCCAITQRLCCVHCGMRARRGEFCFILFALRRSRPRDATVGRWPKQQLHEVTQNHRAAAPPADARIHAKRMLRALRAHTAPLRRSLDEEGREKETCSTTFPTLKFYPAREKTPIWERNL